MKKSFLTFLLTIFISIVCCQVGFAATNEIVTFSCNTTTSLTKNISIKATSDIIINWGDGSSDQVIDGQVSDFYDISVSHTYQASGHYLVTIKANDISKLTLQNNDIVEIDLRNAVSLEELNISNNKLNYLDLSSNSLLKNVICSNNYLAELKVSSGQISTLDASNNKISVLTVPNTIKDLYVSGNLLKVINGKSNFNLAGFTRLVNLKCADNRIEEISFDNCTNLEKIDCSNNFIKNISFGTNSKLKEIYCNGNVIENLNISNNSLLEILNCSHNKLSKLDISQNNRLKKLYMYQNSITEGINLRNINFTIVVLDNISTSNNSGDILIKTSMLGSGGIRAVTENSIIFSNIPKSIFINGQEQINPKGEIAIPSTKGEYVFSISFTENSLQERVIINKPQVLEGMIPVKYNGTNWVITNEGDMEWFDYGSNMKWANVMLRDDAYYLYDGINRKKIQNETLNELVGREVPIDYTGSMYVWIPRFTYMTVGNDVSIKYSQGYTDYMGDGYNLPSAFSYGERNLTGIWVAKYPAAGNASNPKYSSNSSKIVNLKIGDAFSAAKITSAYGIGNSISHMMKNSEWGAIAYFAKGAGNIANGSTTGNIYGIFDMDSNAEYVASFIELVGGISNYNVRNNGKNLLPYRIITYNSNYDIADERDIDLIRLNSPFDSADLNYSLLRSLKDLGITEQSANMPTEENTFFIRGMSGIFSYAGTTGAANSNIGFRNVIISNNSMDDSIKTYYTIKSFSNGGGKISPEGITTVEAGQSITYFIIPDSEKEIVDVLVDGISVYSIMADSEYTFNNVNSNHEIEVIFDNKVLPYDVYANINPQNMGTVTGVTVVSGAGGLIGKYNSKSEVSLLATGEYGWEFSNWTAVEGVELSSVASLSNPLKFQMPNSKVQVTANFVKILKSRLTVKNLYGKLSMEKDIGENVTVDARDNTEYEFDSWLTDGIALGAQEQQSTINFNMPPTDVALTARYNKLYKVNVILGDGTQVETYYPATKNVKLIAPATVNGKSFASWTVSGVTGQIGNSLELNFAMPSNNVSIQVNYN